MSNSLSIEQNNVIKILIGAVSIPVGFSSVEKEGGFLAQFLEFISKINEWISFVLLSHQIEADNEVWIGSFHLSEHFHVIIEFFLRHFSVTGVNHFQAQESRMIFDKSTMK